MCIVDGTEFLVTEVGAWFQHTFLHRLHLHTLQSGQTCMPCCSIARSTSKLGLNYNIPGAVGNPNKCTNVPNNTKEINQYSACNAE